MTMPLPRSSVHYTPLPLRRWSDLTNFVVLALVTWMYTRPTDATLRWIEEKCSAKPLVRDANVSAFKAGHAVGEPAELFDHPYEVAPAVQAPGYYTNIKGNTALAWGLVAAGQLAQLQIGRAKV